MSSRRSSLKYDRTRLLRNAAKEDDLATVTTLLSHKVDVDSADPYGNTPLMIAADRGNRDICEELLDNGAKINLEDSYGQTALTYAAFGGHWNVVELLVERKARLNQTTKYGQTPIMKAAYANSLSVVSYLHMNGAKIDERNNEGRTALMIASDANNLNIVQYLATIAKADKDAVDNEGNTALMLAARKEHVLVIEYLASINASESVRNTRGEDVLDIAPIDGSTDMAGHRDKIQKALRRGHEAAKDQTAEAVHRRLLSTNVMISPQASPRLESGADGKQPPAFVFPGVGGEAKGEAAAEE